LLQQLQQKVSFPALKEARAVAQLGVRQ
jgi:hypothetical protein